MSRQVYKPTPGSDAVTAGILECYNSLTPDGKAAVDALAAAVIKGVQASRPGLQGLGKQGAIELIGKLLIYADGKRVKR